MELISLYPGNIGVIFGLKIVVVLYERKHTLF
jgi:hypothetical protein